MSRREDFYWWRLLATGFSFAVFGIGGLILGYVIFPLVALISPDHVQRTKRCRLFIHYSFRLFIGIMRGLGVLSWEARGVNKLAGKGVLVVANHPTLIDVVFLISLMPDASCIIKSALYRNIFARGPVSWAGYIPNDTPEQLLEDCSAELRRGTSLVVFPEGTRSVKGRPLRFRRGAAYIWLETQCELVLATIASSPPTLSKQEKWFQIPARRPHFSVVLRKSDEAMLVCPMAAAQNDARQLNRHWQSYFEQEIVT